jgi:hypothetical protein
MQTGRNETIALHRWAVIAEATNVRLTPAERGVVVREIANRAVERRIEVLGAAHLELVDDVALLEPRAQVFEAMLDGWRSQQLSRNLTFSTIDADSVQVAASAPPPSGPPAITKKPGPGKGHDH